MSTQRTLPSRGEEAFNAVTHGVAALAAACATAPLLIRAAGDARALVSVSIFCGSMVLLFAASALYHALSRARAARWLQTLDHLSIFLLIAGTYTPFCLLAIGGALGWTLFGLVAGLALFGIFVRLLAPRLGRRVSTVLYLAMGWIGMIAIGPLIRSIGLDGFAWVLGGGAAYTIGVFFYARKQRAWMHALWHLFVMAGATLHGVAVFHLLAN